MFYWVIILDKIKRIKKCKPPYPFSEFAKFVYSEGYKKIEIEKRYRETGILHTSWEYINNEFIKSYTYNLF